STNKNANTRQPREMAAYPIFLGFLKPAKNTAIKLLSFIGRKLATRFTSWVAKKATPLDVNTTESNRRYWYNARLPTLPGTINQMSNF
ncbi:MAG: hypothetical protein O6909_13565, partial [Alphaproteobacteria bacterium]|nr:hypothetical protein [Alphaproteobacteria bacterium]